LVCKALQIDLETGRDFWWKAIEMELNKVVAALEFEENMTPNRLEMTCRRHMLDFKKLRAK
jgi:hypothetical protein